MEESKMFSSWTETGESFSQKPKRLPPLGGRKSIFTKEPQRDEFEIKQAQLEKRKDSIEKISYTDRSRRYSSENEHTIIDIVDEVPSSSYRKQTNKSKSRRSNKEKPTEKESSGTEHSFESSLSEAESEQSSHAEGSETSIVKTTAALLLAEEHENILGSPLSRNG
jgi:hypothetical protein